MYQYADISCIDAEELIKGMFMTRRQVLATLNQFTIIRPQFEMSQIDLLHWIAKAHCYAQSIQRGADSLSEKSAFNPVPSERENFMKQLLIRVGGGSDRILFRGIEVPDVLLTDFSQMLIYQMSSQSDQVGAGMFKRMQFFADQARSVFARFYPEDSRYPDHLIHVTCTGYISPSAAQSLIDLRGWHGKLDVTHAYHMGCYASIPAIRMGAGQLALSLKDSYRVDIVHTEICSLHFNPFDHSIEQMLVQSLFGDGHIQYSLSRFCPEDSLGLDVLNLSEFIVPNSQESMSWQPADWGMKMTLSKDVPKKIAEAVEPFLDHLLENTDFQKVDIQEKAIFAIHPGGPKIIDSLQSLLKLTDQQVFHSRNILKQYGNMSSATLPHVWKSILEDVTIASQTLIISLAFGPGLTIFGLLLRKK